jgi:hypothetical protein
VKKEKEKKVREKTTTDKMNEKRGPLTVTQYPVRDM